jgi:hypothetical protein
MIERLRFFTALCFPYGTPYGAFRMTNSAQGFIRICVISLFSLYLRLRGVIISYIARAEADYEYLIKD